MAESMVGVVRLAEVRTSALSVDEVLALVADPAVGGIALFVGTVRDHDGGRDVQTLEYEAHPDAAAAMREVACEVAALSGVVSVAAVHRAGLLDIGDVAVIAAVGCGHRDDAFVAGRQLIDEIKTRVPIWKRQTFTDGDIEWVGIG